MLIEHFTYFNEDWHSIPSTVANFTCLIKIEAFKSTSFIVTLPKLSVIYLGELLTISNASVMGDFKVEATVIFF